LWNGPKHTRRKQEWTNLLQRPIFVPSKKMEYARPVPQNPLTGLRPKVERHWREFRPAMYRELKAAGSLSRVLNQAVDLTSQAYLELLENNPDLGFDRAWEMVKDQWAFPPPEPTDHAPLSALLVA